MAITLFGFIWLLLIMVTFLAFPLKRIAQLVIASCIFQSASIANIGGSSITPLLITSTFFITKCLTLDIQHNNVNFKKIKLPIWGKYLLIFFAYSIIASLTFPSIFKGIHVFPASEGIDHNVAVGGFPLHFSSSNIFQLILLFIYISSTLYFYKYRKYIDFKLLINTIIYSAIVVLVIGFWAYTSKQFNLVPFPHDFFYSNTSFALLTDIKIGNWFRYVGTFTEASGAGLFLSSMFWALAISKHHLNKIFLPIIALALLLTISATGYLGFIFGCGIFILWHSKKYTPYVITAILLVPLLLVISGLLQTIIQLIIEKSTSQSGISRSLADIFSFQLLIKTHFLGVGLGSHRSSSFLFNMLAAVGIIGITLFTIFITKVLKPALKSEDKNNAAFIVMYAVVFLFGQIIASPDLSLPTFWMWIFAAATISINSSATKVSSTSNSSKE